MPPTSPRHPLLENHLRFTALHRAEVLRRPGFIRWRSEMPEFDCLLLESPGALEEIGALRAVRTFPWTGDVGAALRSEGFRESGRLRYMQLVRPRSAPLATAALTIHEARDADALAAFTDVQARAFLEPEEALEPLRAFFHEANHRNLGHAAQTFYVGVHDGRPVAVTLLLVHEDVAGIYGVATLPEYRGRGYSQALLHRAAFDARQKRCQVVGLQVHLGSDAERLYLRLGFEARFECVLWTR
jgi:GNAT superfamily N-acetyltransferase